MFLYQGFTFSTMDELVEFILLDALFINNTTVGA